MPQKESWGLQIYQLHVNTKMLDSVTSVATMLKFQVGNIVEFKDQDPTQPRGISKYYYGTEDNHPIFK